MWKWPSPRQSVCLVAGADAGIAASSFLHTDPLTAMSGTPLFTVVSAFVTFFHGPRLQAGHVAWTAAVIMAIAGWLVVYSGPPGGGAALATSVATAALFVPVAVMPGLQLGFWLVQRSSVDSLVDPLTKLANRRGLGVALGRLGETTTGQSQTHATELCAILIDLDRFKTVNDDYGHDMGDSVLVRTAQRISATVRVGAVVARLGGEEFLVLDLLLPGDAPVVAERIRSAIAAPAEPRITASVGVSTSGTGHAVSYTVDDLIAAADTAMYQAKGRGGDEVVVASEQHR